MLHCRAPAKVKPAAHCGHRIGVHLRETAMKLKLLTCPLLLLLILAPQGAATSASAQSAQAVVNRDPDAARLVSADLAHFWAALDAAAEAGVNLQSSLQTGYLDVGSPGLQAFNTMRIGGAEQLAATIRRRPGYYAALREPSGKLESYRPQMLRSFAQLQSLYPPAVFPDVYFVIGSMTSAGTLTESMLLIGVDMHGRNPQAPLDELGDWERAVIKGIDEIPYIVAHELVHFQQRYPTDDQRLLAHAIKEGAADFIAELIAGRHINGHLHVYGNPRERVLWQEFVAEMHTAQYSNWLYQGAAAKGRPADLGYYVGYRICAAYYASAADKQQAVSDILNIDDFDRFLSDSGYMQEGAEPGAAAAE